MRTVDLEAEFKAILEDIEATCDEGGIASPELIARLDGIQATLEVKLGANAGMIKSLSEQKARVDAEIEKLRRKSKSADEHIEFLKDVTKHAMETAGMTTLTVGLRKLRIQPNSQPKLEVLDESKIERSYFRQPPPKLDKEGVRSAIEAGVPIEGARLVSGTHLRVS